MSRFQELIAAATRVCELEEQGAPAPGIMAAIGRLRSAVAGVRHRGEATLTTFSGVSMQTGTGFVELAGIELPATIPAETAAEIGQSLIAAAATAETEAALLAELRAMDVELEQIGQLLGRMRARRDSAE